MEIQGSMLARNTVVNLMGQALPVVVTLATMPFVLRWLGTQRFGIVAVACVVLVSSTCNLGRAATKCQSEQDRVLASCNAC